MSFWSDLTPITKFVIALGVVAALYLLVAKLGGFFPYNSPADGDRSQQRGLVTG